MVYQLYRPQARPRSRRGLGDGSVALSGMKRLLLLALATAGLLAAAVSTASARSTATRHRPATAPRSAHRLARVAEASRPSLPLPSRSRPHRHRGGRLVAMRLSRGHRDPRVRSGHGAVTGVFDDRVMVAEPRIETRPVPTIRSLHGDPRLARGPPPGMDPSPSLRAPLGRAAAAGSIFAAPIASRARHSAASLNPDVTRWPSRPLHARRLEGAAACFEPPSNGGFPCPA